MRLATLAVLLMMIVAPATTLFPSAPPQRDVPGEVDAARHALQAPATIWNMPAENGEATALLP